MESGLLAGRVPYLRGGAGPRQASVFFGVNALFRRLDRVSNPERYAAQVARLIPGHRFTIFGYGGGAGFDRMADDIAAAARNPPDLVIGISLGGFAAMRFAARHRTLAPRLVLLCSAHRFSGNGQLMLARQFEALERGDLLSLFRQNALLFRRPWYNWLLRLKLWQGADRLAAGARDPAAILRDYRQLLGSDLPGNAAHARQIACPTLILGGAADQLFDRQAFEETAALIPAAGTRLQLFKRETHMLPIEKSGAVMRAIRAFSG